MKEEEQRKLLEFLGKLFSNLSVVRKDLWKDYAYEFFEKLEKDDLIAECKHRWTDARNEKIESGEWCPRCGKVRASNQAE